MKNCENYNHSNEVVIFVHGHIQLLSAQLKASNWGEPVQQLWENVGVDRLFTALRHHPHPQIAQYVVETKITQLIKDLDQHPRKGQPIRNPEYEHAMLQLQMLLIPSYFVRTCTKQIDELTKLSANPTFQAKGQP